MLQDILKEIIQILLLLGNILRTNFRLQPAKLLQVRKPHPRIHIFKVLLELLEVLKVSFAGNVSWMNFKMIHGIIRGKEASSYDLMIDDLHLKVLHWKSLSLEGFEASNCILEGLTDEHFSIIRDLAAFRTLNILYWNKLYLLLCFTLSTISSIDSVIICTGSVLIMLWRLIFDGNFLENWFFGGFLLRLCPLLFLLRNT